jgi:hypothetical protein
VPSVNILKIHSLLTAVAAGMVVKNKTALCWSNQFSVQKQLFAAKPKRGTKIVLFSIEL